ncbi:MAG: hypothetical protein O6702_04315 [Candidatus Dadabacteria bacterium]|nr:hypothetical protein [Candidatus Dadabacteria bacterium]
MKEINTKIEGTYIIIPLLLLLLIAGCNKDPDYIPGLGIQGYRAPISKILFSPLAYDGATLAIEGFARDFAEEPVDGSDTSEDVTTTFKLTDLKGNYIIILLPGQWEIVENDYLIVGGIYRKNGNELEAQQFEIVDFEKKDEKGRYKEIEKRDEW